MLSLAAKTTASAQETTPGQASSSSNLMISITSKPFNDSLGGDSFSLCIPSTESSKTEASHPCYLALIHSKTTSHQLVFINENFTRQHTLKIHVFSLEPFTRQFELEEEKQIDFSRYRDHI